MLSMDGARCSSSGIAKDVSRSKSDGSALGRHGGGLAMPYSISPRHNSARVEELERPSSEAQASTGVPPQGPRRRRRRLTWALGIAAIVLTVIWGLIETELIDLDVVRACVLSRIAGVYPDRANAYEFLSKHYNSAGRTQDAVDACEKLVQVKPNDPQARALLGDAYREVSRPQEAIACYGEALSLDPNSYEAHLGLGRVYAAMNLHAEALDAYKQAVRVRPDSASAHVALGLALSNLGRYEEAMQAFKQAKELDPEISETQVFSGKAYLEAGLCQQAIECFQDVILIDQGHAQAHYNLGRAYLSVGDVDLARQEQCILEELDANLAGQLHDLIRR